MHPGGMPALESEKNPILAVVMPSTLTSLHFHVIFAVKHREPRISPEWIARLHEYLGGTVRGLGGTTDIIGGVADHVHMLIALKPTHRLSDIMREVKRSSSVWIAETLEIKHFRWQEGYAAFSVSASAINSVTSYIVNQAKHHQIRGFDEELAEFLEKSGAGVMSSP